MAFKDVIDILVNGKWNGSSEIKRAERDIGGLSDIAKGFAQGLGINVFDTVKDAVVDATRAVIEFGQESIEIAGTVGETTSLLQTSLGPAYEAFTAQVDAVSDATGRSALKFQEAVSPILAMQRSMGFAQEEAGNLSVAFGQAALDLESFFNTSTGFEDIQGALAGSSETLQKYGIDVRETTLQNRALELGLIDTRDEYDRQVRSLVILEEIQRQAADAMGDAARTAGSAVNQQRALTDQVFELKAAIGEELLPVQEELVRVQREFLNANGDKAVALARDLASAYIGLNDALAGLGAWQEQNKNSFWYKLFFGFELNTAPTWLDVLVEKGEKVRQVQELFQATASVTSDADDAAQGYGDSLTDLEDIQGRIVDTSEDYVSSLEREAAAQRLAAKYRDQAFTGIPKRKIGADEFGALVREASFFVKVIKEANSALRVTPELAEAAAATIKEKLAVESQEIGVKFVTDLESIAGLQAEAAALGEAFNTSLAGLNGRTADQLLFEVGKQAGLAAGPLGQLAFNTGEYTGAAINAALESAIMAQKIEELAGVVAGKVSAGVPLDQALQDAYGEIVNLRSSMEESRQSRLDYITDTENINTELAKLEGDRNVEVNLNVTGLEALKTAASLISQLPSVAGGSVPLSAAGIPLPPTYGNDGPGGVSAPSTRAPARAQGFSQ